MKKRKLISLIIIAAVFSAALTPSAGALQVILTPPAVNIEFENGIFSCDLVTNNPNENVSVFIIKGRNYTESFSGLDDGTNISSDLCYTNIVKTGDNCKGKIKADLKNKNAQSYSLVVRTEYSYMRREFSESFSGGTVQKITKGNNSAFIEGITAEKFQSVKINVCKNKNIKNIQDIKSEESENIYLVSSGEDKAYSANIKTPDNCIIAVETDDAEFAFDIGETNRYGGHSASEGIEISSPLKGITLKDGKLTATVMSRVQGENVSVILTKAGVSLDDLKNLDEGTSLKNFISYANTDKTNSDRERSFYLNVEHDKRYTFAARSSDMYYQRYLYSDFEGCLLENTVCFKDGVMIKGKTASPSEKIEISVLSGNKVNNLKTIENGFDGNKQTIYSDSAGDYSQFLETNGDCTIAVRTKEEYAVIAAYKAEIIYVSAEGSDETGDGTEAFPYATLAKAKNEIRNLDKKGIRTVIIKGGTYRINSPVTFSGFDSGTESNPVIYKAAEGEEVVFTGENEISLKSAKKISGTTESKLFKEDVRDKIYEIQLDESVRNIFDFVTPFKEEKYKNIKGRPAKLYINSKELLISRWPNFGYSLITQAETNDERLSVKLSDEVKSEWNKSNDWFLGGYIGADWYDEWCMAENVSGDSVSLRQAPKYPVSDDARVYVVNNMYELDMPGEYCIDFKTMKLFIYPFEPIGKNDKLTVAAYDNNFINVVGAKDIAFKDIIFEKTSLDKKLEKYNESSQNGIYIESSQDITIDGCSFRDIGGNGVYVNSGSGVTVKNCYFDKIGFNGIVMGGGSIETMAESNNLIKDNVISSPATETGDNGQAGIKLTKHSVGTTVENNLIRNCKNSAIIYNGAEHTIRYNEIVNTVNDTSDAGAIYAGRSLTDYNNNVYGNYFYDVGMKKETRYHAVGMYLDDWESGTNFFDNIIVMNNPVSSSGVLIHGGRDNVIRNNVFVKSENSVNLKSKAFDKANTAYLELKNVCENNSALLSKYPKIAETYRLINSDGYTYNDTVINNFFAGMDILEQMPMKNITIYGNEIEEYSDSLFNDPAEKDYSLKGGGFDIGLTGNSMSSAEPERSAFEIVFPQKGQILSEIPYARWSRSSFADVYEIEIASDAKFENVIKKYETKDTGMYIDGIAPGEYYMRAKALSLVRREKSVVISDTVKFKVGPYCKIAGVYSDNESAVADVVSTYDEKQSVNMLVALDKGKNTGKYIYKDIVLDKGLNKVDLSDIDISYDCSNILIYLWDTRSLKPFSEKYEQGF